MIELALVLARTSLALVLGTAGLAKLADGAGSRQAMFDFGVTQSWPARSRLLCRWRS